MQVNTLWHSQRVRDPQDLLDPATNLRVAAVILAEAMKSTPDLELGIGRYHHWTDETKSRAYAKRVIGVWHRLQKVWER